MGTTADLNPRVGPPGAPQPPVPFVPNPDLAANLAALSAGQLAVLAAAIATNPEVAGRYELLVDSIFLGVHDFSAVVGATLAQATVNSRQRVWSFAANEAAYMQWEGVLPSHWSTFTVDIHYLNLGAGSGNIRLYCDHLLLGPGDSVNTPANASVQGVVAAGAQYVETLRRAKVTTVPDVEGFAAPTGTDRVLLSVRRQGSDASDTLENALGVKGLTLTKLT